MVSKENKPDKKTSSKQKDEKGKVDNWYVDPKREPEVADRQEKDGRNVFSSAHPESDEDDESIREAEETNLYDVEFFNPRRRSEMTRHHKDGHTS